MSTSTENNNSTSSDNSGTSAVNSQVIDSIKEINKLINEGGKNLDGVANQVLTQAASMAMLNIVNQQQQMHMLQNTVTTVAAKAMLESNPEEAVKLMNSVLDNSSIAQNLKDLKDLVDSIN